MRDYEEIYSTLLRRVLNDIRTTMDLNIGEKMDLVDFIFLFFYPTDNIIENIKEVRIERLLDIVLNDLFTSIDFSRYTKEEQDNYLNNVNTVLFYLNRTLFRTSQAQMKEKEKEKWKAEYLDKREPFMHININELLEDLGF